MTKYNKKKFEHLFLLFYFEKFEWYFVWYYNDLLILRCVNQFLSLCKCLSFLFYSILLSTPSLCWEENTSTACPQRITYLLPLICTWTESSCSFISCLLLEKPKNNSVKVLQCSAVKVIEIFWNYDRLEIIWGIYHLLYWLFFFF